MIDSMQRATELDYNDVAFEIEGILEELATIKADRALVRLVGERGVEQLNKKMTQMRSRMSDDFTLVIAGDFKRGKSTLVNALLAQEVVPSAVMPETVTFNHIHYAEKPSFSAVLENKRRISLSQGEITRSELEKLSTKLPKTIDHLDIGVPNDLLQNLTIIDTPGLSDLMKSFDRRVAEYVSEADAIIFVVSALAPLSMDERDFLSTAVLPQNYSRILVALNMTDALESDDDEERVTELLRHKAATISDKLYVFPLSALDELCRATNRKRPNPQREDCFSHEFQRFRMAIEDDVLLQRDTIKAERCIASCDQMLTAWQNQLMLCRQALTQNADGLLRTSIQLHDENAQLEQELANHKDCICSDTDVMRIEARKWMAEYLVRLRNELVTCNTKAETREVQRHLQFYLTDKIREGLDACIQHHTQAIAAIASEYANDLTVTVLHTIQSPVQTSVAKNIADVRWTSADTVVRVMSKTTEVAASVGISKSALGDLILVGTIIAGFFREKQMKSLQSDIVNPLLLHFEEVEQSVLDTTNTIYAEMSDNACRLLEEHYATILEQSTAAVDNARKALEEEGIRSDVLAETIDDTLAQIEGMRTRIKQYA